MPKRENVDRLTISIDANIKRQFDVVCRWKNTNMSEVSQALITNWLLANAPEEFLQSEQKQND